MVRETPTALLLGALLALAAACSDEEPPTPQDTSCGGAATDHACWADKKGTKTLGSAGGTLWVGPIGLEVPAGANAWDVLF